MRYFEQIARNLPVQPALDELDASRWLWNVMTARQNTPGSAHHDTECIVLRGPKALTLENVFTELRADWVEYITALPALHKLASAAVDLLGEVEQLGRVMVVSLKAGGRIDLHNDTGPYAEHYDRFHVALTSAPGNWFYCGDEAVAMKPGEMWKFDHHSEHHVANLSGESRIHLIIDARLRKGT